MQKGLEVTGGIGVEEEKLGKQRGTEVRQQEW